MRYIPTAAISFGSGLFAALCSQILATFNPEFAFFLAFAGSCFVVMGLIMVTRRM